ncbi:cobalamin-binding protein [Soehngenia longivitae]|uniref:Cobalamin-binding protein n=1 Tax=Soehngenia longivitae TaxID=2562294 RepID=A0A4Z0D683_9FIRM|nr:cobalamin-binding protein [Soehngenia longivitae]TFZ40374.1 cobalamin-binding protein [Soehngenia longivitae]
MKKRSLYLLLALLIILGSISGCSSSTSPAEDNPQQVAETIEITDDFGKVITLEKPAEKIVSLAPSQTEILFAIGAGEKVVGVTTADDYPEEVKEIEKVGGFDGWNLEMIIALEPDLVINYGQGSEEDNKRFEEAGIVVASFLPETIDDVMDTIEKIGVLTGNSDKAKEVVEDMKSERDEIISKVKDLETKRVFYEVYNDPLMTAGPGSFIDELINLAGGENIAKDADSPYPQYDVEKLIEKNPEVYLIPDDSTTTLETLKERPGFENIDAIKNSQVYFLDADIVSRAGPRIIQGLEEIAKAIHPEID